MMMVTTDNFQQFRNSDKYLDYLLSNSNGINTQQRQQALNKRIDERSATMSTITASIGAGASTLTGLAGLASGNALAVGQGIQGVASAFQQGINADSQIKRAGFGLETLASSIRDARSNNLNISAYGTEMDVYNLIDGSFSQITIIREQMPKKLKVMLGDYYNKYGVALGSQLMDPYDVINSHQRFNFIQTDLESVYSALLPNNSTHMSQILAKSFAEGIRF